MAAPSIPNLNTLKAGLGRGRGRGLRDLGSASTNEDAGKGDKLVQQTDQDASISRLSAVKLGYLKDPFAELFAPSSWQRRFPIINRGTYVRTHSIDHLVNTFLQEHHEAQNIQIVSLGAGSDTRYFRMAQDASKSAAGPKVIYHELDFPENTASKVRAILNSRAQLQGLLDLKDPTNGLPAEATGWDQTDTAQSSLHTSTYHIHPIDLRTLNMGKDLPPSLKVIDTSVPTLIISECCLTYLRPCDADKVVNFFAKSLFAKSTPLAMVLYEPIRPEDAFGKVMVSNLAARGIVLQTLKRYGSLEAQAARMKMHGFQDSRGLDVHQIWEGGVTEIEKERIAGLELLDELEEWVMLAQHYCVVWAWRGTKDHDVQSSWGAWKTAFR